MPRGQPQVAPAAAEGLDAGCRQAGDAPEAGGRWHL